MKLMEFKINTLQNQSESTKVRYHVKPVKIR